MRKTFLLWLCLTGLATYGQTDSSLQRYWYTEGTLSYLSFGSNGGYQEINLELYSAYALSPRWQVGPRFRQVLFRDYFPSSDWQRFFLAGVNLRGELLYFGDQQGSLFIDLGLYRGNYCTCYDRPLYYRREGLWYLGWGLGGRWFPFANLPRLGVVAAMNLHSVLAEGLFRFDVYNYPHLGLSWRYAQ